MHHLTPRPADMSQRSPVYLSTRHRIPSCSRSRWVIGADPILFKLLAAEIRIFCAASLRDLDGWFCSWSGRSLLAAVSAAHPGYGRRLGRPGRA